MKYACVILAAGESKRFAGCKLLAQVQGKPLLQHALDKGQLLFSEHLYVVTGAWHKQLQQAVGQGQLSELNAIFNPDWQLGMSSGISLATKRLESEYDYLCFMLADQLALEVSELRQLLDMAVPNSVVAARYNDTLGVPAIFPRFSYPALKKLQGACGARALLRNQQLPVKAIDLPSAAEDIDLQADLNRWQCQKQGI